MTQKKRKAQDATEASCTSLFFSNRCSDLLTTAFQPKEHSSKDEQQPARRLRNSIGSRTGLPKCNTGERRHRIIAKNVLQ